MDNDIIQCINAVFKFWLKQKQFECGYEWTSDGWVEKKQKGGIDISFLYLWDNKQQR